MLVLTVTLLSGTLRATGMDDSALTGLPDEGEWPPSPARLFSALVAADGTGPRLRVTDGSELLLLERAEAPFIVADPPDRVLRSRLLERFVVKDEDHRHVDNQTRRTSAVHEYPGRTSSPVRPGTRLAPMHPSLSYVWRDIVLEAHTRSALELRAARVGYLGCADSPARVSVSEELPEGGSAWVPDPTGTTALAVPYDGFLAALDDTFSRFCNGETVRRATVPTRYQGYRPPGFAQVVARRKAVVWVRFDSSVSGHHLLAVTETLRAAVLERYTHEIGGDQANVPPYVSGHGFPGPGYHQIQFLALPDAGFAHSRGRLYGAAVVLPPEPAPDMAETLRAAIWRIRRLVRPGVFDIGVRLHGGEQRPFASSPTTWTRPSQRWTSVTPVVHERYQRGGPDLSAVAKWCEHAGIPERPIWARTPLSPIFPGALALPPEQVHRSGRERLPYSHLEVVFDRDVTGPVVLGRARQFGFGLMLPSSRTRDADA
ncbi:MAG: type I-G CRISPR-associated protein Csb2 [Candidatus Dormibacteria bacterium]